MPDIHSIKSSRTNINMRKEEAAALVIALTRALAEVKDGACVSLEIHTQGHQAGLNAFTAGNRLPAGCNGLISFQQVTAGVQ